MFILTFLSDDTRLGAGLRNSRAELQTDRGMQQASQDILIIIIIMYIYHALINALSAHIIHVNLNEIIYTHVQHSPTKQFT